MGGTVHLPVRKVRAIESQKWMLGRAFDYSRVTIKLEDEGEMKIILPDVLLQGANESLRMISAK